MSQNAGPTWNNFNVRYNFNSYPQASGLTTFVGAYNGSDIARDFDAIIKAVADELDTIRPGVDDNDLMNETLENWPDTKR